MPSVDFIGGGGLFWWTRIGLMVWGQTTDRKGGTGDPDHPQVNPFMTAVRQAGSPVGRAHILDGQPQP